MLTACSGSTTETATPLVLARDPAVSRLPPPPLPGTVLVMSGVPERVAVDGYGTVAVNVRRPNAVVLFDLADPSGQRTIRVGRRHPARRRPAFRARRDLRRGRRRR